MTALEHHDHRAGENHVTSVAVPVEAMRPSDTIPITLRPEDLLLICSDTLDDMEHVRMATANRIGAMQRIKGLAGTPEEARLQGLLDGLKALEHGAELELKRALRKHPLGPWVKATVGVGEKQAARLLGLIGDPYWNSLHNRPRTVSELWAYCGYHVLPAHSRSDTHTSRGGDSSPGLTAGAKTQDCVAGAASSLPTHRCSDTQKSHGGEGDEGNPGQRPIDAHVSAVGVAPRRQRGQRANWDGQARSRTYLIAESCIKQRHSPYRKVYDDGRAKYAESVHAVPCVQCGTKGKPAEAGTDLRDGHKHARALRLVAKAVLKDLWLTARDAHHPLEPSMKRTAAGVSQ